jgi:hypothetical protein
MVAAQQRVVIRVVRVLPVAKVLSTVSVRYVTPVRRALIKAKARQLPSVRMMSTRSARPSQVRSAPASS